VKSGRDFTLVILFAVLIFIFRLLVDRGVGMISIPGFAYVLSMFFSVIYSLAFLMYKGRRWRLFFQALLSTLLYLAFINSAFRPTEMATLLNMFIVDVVFNSLYGLFERKNKLLWLTILFQVYFWATYSLWLLVFYSVLFYPFEAFLKNWFIPTMSIMPVLIVEGLAGGFIGYQIYRRVKKFNNF
jgi:hypothetical protein